MNELMIVANVAIVFGVVYKLFELFVCKKERTMLIEKLPADFFYEGKPKNLDFSSVSLFSSFGKFTALRFGMLFLGLGCGLILGYAIIQGTLVEYFQDRPNWEIRDTASIVFGASTLIGGGIGLVLSFIIEVIVLRKK